MRKSTGEIREAASENARSRGLALKLLMLEFDTPFRQRVARSLKAPNSPDFDLKAWEALIKASDLTSSDLGLCATAMWLGTEVASLRDHLAKHEVAPLSAQLATTLAIATLNREFFVLDNKLLKAQKATVNAGPVILDHLANTPIGSGDGLFKVDASSRTDAATDAIDSWLFDAVDIQSNPPVPSDLAAVAAGNLQRFSLHRSHYDVWQQALWEDWRLISAEEHLVFTPADRDMAKLADVWRLRQESIFTSSAWKEMAAWPHMSTEERRELLPPRTVIDVEQSPGRRRRFVVARPPIKRMPSYAFSRIGLERSYLAPFLERPLPAHPELTSALILQAWYVALDLAKVLAAARPRPSFFDVENVRRWALVVRRSELVDVLVRALAITNALAENIADFLTWAKGTYKGLWGAPLVPIPGRTEDLAMAESVLATSNVIRRMEIWLTKGRLDDTLSNAPRGRSFEAQLRIDVRRTLAANPIVRDTASIEYAIKKGQDFPEEIDFLIQFGPLLLVGEVKCLLFPADSRERFNFLRNLRSACAQASRKTAAIIRNPGIAAKALGIAEAVVQNLRPLPIVVLNQTFGASLVIGDCVVIDAQFLDLYLGSGSYVSEGIVSPKDGGRAVALHHLYRTAADAVSRFEATMRRPPPLHRLQSLLRWGNFAFPTSSGKPLFIAQTVLGDLPEETRLRVEALSAVVGR